MEDILECAKLDHPKMAVEQGWNRQEMEEHWKLVVKKAQEAHEEKYHWRNQEMKDRIYSLKERLKEIRSADPEGEFVVPCVAIEDKFNEFISQVKSILHTQPKWDGKVNNTLVAVD